MANGINSTQGTLAAYTDAQNLMVNMPQVRTYLAEPARQIFDDAVVLKPASFWSPVYLRQLGDLAQAMYILSEYQAEEAKAVQKERLNIDRIEWLSKRINEKLTLIKHLQNLLQLTPTQTMGQSRDVNKGVEQSIKMVEIINDNPEDLYS